MKEYTYALARRESRQELLGDTSDFCFPRNLARATPIKRCVSCCRIFSPELYFGLALAIAGSTCVLGTVTIRPLITVGTPDRDGNASKMSAHVCCQAKFLLRFSLDELHVIFKQPSTSSLMPTIFFKTTGCSANFSDTEIMKGLLAKEGYVLADSEASADVIVFNACTVKGDSPALREVRKLKEQFPNKKIIVGGCVTQSLLKSLKTNTGDISFLNTHNLDKIRTVVDAALMNTQIEVLGGGTDGRTLQKTLLPKVRRNAAVAIIQCESGCDSACAFCSTKLIKGRTQSYSVESICKEAEQAVLDGCREIWLTGTDMSCYGRDIQTDLPALVEAVVNVPGDFMVRIGMANPAGVLTYASRLGQVLMHPKVFKFLHVPIQSGNNRILKLMKRAYTVEEYNAMIGMFRALIPDLTLATDIIVGFPGETNEEFMDSVKHVQEVKPAFCNISRFALRQGTAAVRLPESVQGNVKKDRSTILARAYKNVSLENNKRWIGWEGTVIIEEKGKNDCWLGRTKTYMLVEVQGAFMLGQKVHISITGIAEHHLVGKAIEKEVLAT